MKNYIDYSIDDCDDDAITINDLYIVEGERKKGKGKELVKSVIEYARDNGFLKVNLFVNCTDGSISNDDLIKFYESCGFDSHGDCSELMEYAI